MPIPNIFLWNAGSLPAKRNELILAAAKHNAGVILITETWLTPNDSFNLPGYTTIKDDRTATRGGVAILIHDSINFTNFNPTYNFPFEACFIKLDSPKIILGVVYISQGDQLTTDILNILTNLGSPYIIGGDWNAKHKLWNNFTSNRAGNTLFKHYQTHRYRIVHPQDFTFQSGKRKPSTLDFFLTDIQKNFKCTITDDFNTNHRPVMITPTNTNITQNLHTTTDWTSYQNHTNNMRITYSFRSNQDIDNSITELTKFLHTCRARAKIPATNMNNEAHHYNDAVLQSLIRHRRAIRKKGQILGAHIVSYQMKDITATIKKRITYLRSRKWDHTLRSFQKPDPTFWPTYRKLSTSKEDKILPPLISESRIITSTEDKVESLAATFTAVHNQATQLNSNHQAIIEDFAVTFNQRTVTNDTDFPISPYQIFNYIKFSANRKAPGNDGITTLMLKHASKKIILQIYYIFRFTISIGYFPDKWKIAKVIPIPKPGKPRNSLTSYRPISLLSILGKLLERCIHAVIMDHLSINNTLANQQFGFRRGHSTIQQILRISQSVIHEMNVNRCVAMVLLDLSKAFDTVWHEALLYKLYKIGIPYGLLKLACSYLTNRKMFVHGRGANSKMHPVTAGVPQGSILGPIFFNIYINDIPKINSCELALYADDTAIYSSSWQLSALIPRLQSYINDILIYLANWKLQINPDKTEAILFTRRKNIIASKNKFSIQIHGTPIPWQEQVKYLGIQLHHKMLWNVAIEERIVKTLKVAAHLYPYISYKSPLNLSLRINIYKSCIRPVLTYGTQAWWFTTSTNRERVQTTQNRILRTILHPPLKYTNRALHEDANILYIHEYINKLINSYDVNNHSNPLARQTGTYDKNKIPYRIKIPFPMSR